MRGLTWRPAARREPVLRDLDLTIGPGERVVLAGPSGAGKSTLLRAIAGLLLTADVGDLAGEVLVDGAAPHDVPGRVGLLLQDPTAAVVAERVGRDVAFGLENLQVPRAEIWPRVREALERVGFTYDAKRLTSALSGGESQRLALAGALAMAPGALLLDEPTSMLDPASAAAVRESILDVTRSLGSTLVVVAHHLEPWVEKVDRLLVMDRAGALVADGEPRTVLADQVAALARQGIWVPGVPGPEPVDIPAELVAPHLSLRGGGGPLVRVRDAVVRHRPRLLARQASTTVALDGVDADLGAGSVLAVTGPSGAGKSTLLGLLAGLQRPDGGRVESSAELVTANGPEPWRWRSRELAARLSWVPQQPEHGVVARTVRDEVLVASRALGRPLRDAERRAARLLDALGLEAIAGAGPYQLSGGEQRRLMLAAALAHGPYAVLLDEPTVGQDRNTWATIVGVCRAVAENGGAAAMATHDTAAVGAVADRELRLAGGRAQ